MKIVSFNVRCSWDKDGVNSFPHRVGCILDKIDSESPDIIAFQEVTERIYAYFKKHMTGYTFVGHGRNEDYHGEGVYIAFKDTLKLINVKTYWLSDTPDVAGSRYAIQSKCPRVCVDALLMGEDKFFRVINVHLDHISDEARILGIKQIIGTLEKDAKVPQNTATVILGDFNARPDSETIKFCDATEYVDITKDIEATYHNYGRRFSKIDYIYLDGDSAKLAKNLTRWEDEVDGIYLSDHYPIAFEM